MQQLQEDKALIRSEDSYERLTILKSELRHRITQHSGNPNWHGFFVASIWMPWQWPENCSVNDLVDLGKNVDRRMLELGRKPTF
jgi:hypothetical protein